MKDCHRNKLCWHSIAQQVLLVTGLVIRKQCVDLGLLTPTAVDPALPPSCFPEQGPLECQPATKISHTLLEVRAGAPVLLDELQKSVSLQSGDLHVGQGEGLEGLK